MKIIDDSLIEGHLNAYKLVENLPMCSVKNMLGDFLLGENYDFICRVMNREIKGLGAAFIKAKGEK